MAISNRKVPKPPIVEAVVDIDCDLPPKTDIRSLETPARERFSSEYPEVKTRLLLEDEFQTKDDERPQAKTRRDVQGYMFLQEDGKQLVQVRGEGYSFNRLAPYSSLDDYISEIRRTWTLYLEVARPVQVTTIRLRYINKINLPVGGDKVDLDDYLKLGPRLPDEEQLMLKGFLIQYAAGETGTGNEVKTILTSQNPEGAKLPIILDITASHGIRLNPEDWDGILVAIQSLRKLKNKVFWKTLKEEKCLPLFQ